MLLIYYLALAICRQGKIGNYRTKVVKGQTRVYFRCYSIDPHPNERGLYPQLGCVYVGKVKDEIAFTTNNFKKNIKPCF